MDYYTAYKPIRNRLRKFNPASVLSRALEVLWQAADSEMTALQRAPWNVLLLVKWALLNEDTSDRRGPDMPMEVFDAIRQELWSFPDRVDMIRKGSMPVRLFMRRLLFQQIEFQRKVTPGFVRQPAILASLPPEHALRGLFRTRAGMEPLDFLDLSLAAHSAILNGRAQMTRDWYRPLLPAYGSEKINAFLRCVSADYPELVAYMRGLKNVNERNVSEHFHFTPLKRLPFLRTQGIYVCWHRMVFLRGMEEFAHLLMSEAGADYVRRFGKVFERYIIAEIVKTGRHFYDEDALRQTLGNDIEVPDAVIPMGAFNLIVEAKAGLFDDSLMTIGDPEYFMQRTRPLAKAIRQGWSASVAVRKGTAPADLRNAAEDYLFVVTNKPLNVGSGSDLRSLYPVGELEYPNEEAKALLPFERVYFVSVEEFEHLIASAADAPALHEFLRETVRLDADPATGRLFFDDHLKKFAGLKESSFLDDALDASNDRVERALSTAERAP